jgi:hypothetical protein
MPDEIQYDASATPAQFTNNADIVIEQGTHVRVKIIGLRTEVGEMWAIGSINGDFLGWVALERARLQSRVAMLTIYLTVAAVCRHRNPTDRHGAPTGERKADSTYRCRLWIWSYRGGLGDIRGRVAHIPARLLVDIKLRTIEHSMLRGDWVQRLIHTIRRQLPGPRPSGTEGQGVEKTFAHCRAQFRATPQWFRCGQATSRYVHAFVTLVLAGRPTHGLPAPNCLGRSLMEERVSTRPS